MTDIIATRQSYKRYGIAGLGHISGLNNPADALTKLKHNKILEEIYFGGKMSRVAEKWIDRSMIQPLSSVKQQGLECKSPDKDYLSMTYSKSEVEGN